MLNTRLIRFFSNNAFTAGKILFPETNEIVETLELPWKNNTKNISCIPTGNYVCKRIISPKFGNTFEVCNVPNRKHILFHTGNSIKDSRGCILIGKFLDDKKLNGGFISESKKTFKVFMDFLKDYDTFNIVIEEDKNA